MGCHKTFVLTSEQEEYLRNNYHNQTQQQIADLFGCKPSIIKSFVSDHKIYKRNDNDIRIGNVFHNLRIISDIFRLDEPRGDFLTKRVTCECLLCGKTHVVRVFKLKDGSVKSCGCNQHGNPYRKYQVNHDFFDNWSKEMAYILGFITADGYICDHILGIKLQARDIEILDYIKNALEYTGPICYEIGKLVVNEELREYPQRCLAISSVKLNEGIRKHGICERKSGKEILPDVPDEYFYDYLRGFFDGDGSIYKVKDKRKARIYVGSSFACSNRDFLEDLRFKCGNIGSIHKASKGKCFAWKIAHYDTLALCEKMYASYGFSLKRKKDKWVEACKINYKSVYAEKHIEKILSLSC